MIPEVGILTVIGMALTLILYWTKWWSDRNSDLNKEKKELTDEWKNARSNNNRGAILNLLDKLRRKK